MIQPRKGPLDDPAPPAQPASVRGAAHREPRLDMPRSQPTPNRRRVVAAIPEHTVWPLSRSTAGAAQRGNRIHQREGFLRVVPIRSSEAHRKFLREHPPGDAAAEDKQNAGETRAIGDARPSAFRSARGVGKNGSTRSHNESESSAAAIPRSRYFARRG